MVLKQKQTNFFVLEASKRIIPNKAFFIFFLFWRLMNLRLPSLRISPSLPESTCNTRGNDVELPPWSSLPPWAICMCRELLGCAVRYVVVPWAIWLCRELFGFAVIYLPSPWKFLVLRLVIWSCRELFVCAVRYLFVPWGIWLCHDTRGPP